MSGFETDDQMRKLTGWVLFTLAVIFVVAVLATTYGCATAPPKDCPPCVPEVQIERYPLPVILPWPAPANLPQLALPEYPARPEDDAGLPAWYLALKATAQEREATQTRRIDTLEKQLDTYRKTPEIPTPTP